MRPTIIFVILIFQNFVWTAPLFYWKRDAQTKNFGDELSRVVVERLIQKKIKVIHKECAALKLLGLGSILHFAKNGDYVWGSGRNGKIEERAHRFRRLNVCAVRGPLTRKFLTAKRISCPKIYGDPAILLPELFPELVPTGERPFIIIPNLNEISAYQNFPNLVLPTQEPMHVVKEILKARFVISGSLHGLIVAEAFGIPARLLRVTEAEPLFKYADYYYGSGRTEFLPVQTFQKALELGGEPPARYNKNALIKAFPYHLF